MSRPIRYRMPDGAEIASVDGDIVTMHVIMPGDDAGHIGRRCPACERVFRVHTEDYHALPDDQRLTCPYCATVNDRGEFLTSQQTERARAAVGEYAMQMVEGAFDDMARSFNSRPQGMIRIEMSRSRRSVVPRALPTITEEAPIRERVCSRCSVRYSVFGAHVACPVCGPIPADVAALDAFDSQEALLRAIESVPAEIELQLREAGSLERSAASALGAVVASVETFLRDTFLGRVPQASGLIAGKGNVFQRLDDAADFFGKYLGVDFAAVMGNPDWDRLRLWFGVRHLHTHTNGIVDDRHVARFPNAGHVLGQRVLVSISEAHDVIGLARRFVTDVEVALPNDASRDRAS